MQEKVIVILQKDKLRLLAGLGLFIGLAFIAIANTGWLPNLASEVIRDIGLAFWVSVIIGASYEWVIRTRLLEDTLKIALGYILPDELKAEVRALYEIEFMCTRHLQTMILKPSGDPGVVILYMKIERTLKNVTNQRQTLLVSTSVHEWFLEGVSSKIINVEVTQGERRWTEFKEQKSPGTEPGNKLVASLEPIEVEPDKSVRVLYEVEEVKRATDLHQWVFQFPTIQPEVTFERLVGAGIEGMLGVNIQFQSRDAAKVEKLGNTIRFLGVLLPNQPIELRWWQKQKFEEWMNQ